MIERVQIYGVPATVVATAHITLPGDEQVDVPLQLVQDQFGFPVLRPNFDAVAEVLNDRNLFNV